MCISDGDGIVTILGTTVGMIRGITVLLGVIPMAAVIMAAGMIRGIIAEEAGIALGITAVGIRLGIMAVGMILGITAVVTIKAIMTDITHRFPEAPQGGVRVFIEQVQPIECLLQIWDSAEHRTAVPVPI